VSISVKTYGLNMNIRAEYTNTICCNCDHLGMWRSWDEFKLRFGFEETCLKCKTTIGKDRIGRPTHIVLLKALERQEQKRIDSTDYLGMSSPEFSDRWIKHFFRQAVECASMSTCKSRKVGAVLARNKKVITTGFNGVPSGYPHPEVCIRETLKIPSGEKPWVAECIHAEANCILQCAEQGKSSCGATMFCTNRPCSDCSKLILGAGISAVYYLEEYHLPKDLDFIHDMAKKANVDFIRYDYSDAIMDLYQLGKRDGA